MFQTLQQAVDYIILVDNTEHGTYWINDLYRQNPDTSTRCSGVKCFQPFKNLGVASAQNLAVDFVVQHFDDDNKVIFFDQDSVISPDLPACLAQAFERLSLTTMVAAVGPSFVDEQKSFVYPQVNWSKSGIFQRFIPDPSEHHQPVCSLISSGMLTNVRCLKDIGGYDDSLFIDYVDTDWCLKAQSKNYELYIIPSIQMQHAIGSKSIRVLGRNLSVHSAVRRYYMIRNSFFMLRKPYVAKRLALSFIYRTSVHHFILIMLTPSRCAQLSAFFRGLINGIRHKK